MDKVVTYVLLGEERQATVKGCDSDSLAKDAVLAQIARSFHVRAVTTVSPKKPSLWSLLKSLLWD